MKIFHDWEFLEDGATIAPISVGMVAEDGRELYRVFEEIETLPLYDRIRGHRWLMQNVVPHLPLRSKSAHSKSYAWVSPGSSVGVSFFHLDLTDNRVAPRRMIRNDVRAFIQETPDPELWAWYGAFDHVAYSQLWGRMIDLPEGFPMVTHDIKTLYAMAGDPPAPDQDAGGEHDALADARHDKIMYDHAIAYAGARLIALIGADAARTVADHMKGRSTA